MNQTSTHNDEEMVAWIDEDEKLIKVIPRTLANSDPKYLHPEIAVLIYDKTGKILLQQRAKTKKVAPGVWAVVAGHITYGDTMEDTVHKEVREEMGIDIPVITYTYREKVTMPQETHYCHWYIGEYVGGEIKVEPQEVDDYVWVSSGELEDFKKSHNLSDRTEREMRDFWAGKWDDTLSSQKL